jgi:MFS family permease
MTETEKTNNIPVLIAGIIGWAHDGFALVLVSLLATTISAAYGVDKIAIGFVFSAQYVMTVPGAMIFGELADRFGRKNILLLSVLWDSIFTSLSAIAPTFEIFALLRLLSGLGVSWGISFSLLSETFSSKKRGAAGGLVHATFVVGYIGAVIVTLIFGNIDPISLGPLVLEGWRICFLSALFPIPFLIYLEFALDESQVWSDYKTTQLEEKAGPESVRIFDILKGKWLKFTILLTLLFWLSEFAYHTLADWAPTYFEYLFTYELQKTGGDVDSAGTLSMVVMLGVMVIAAFALFTTGWLSDRIGRRNAFIGCSIIGLLGASIFFVSNFIIIPIIIPLIVIGCLVLTVSFGMHGVFGVWSSEVFPTRFRATATSIIFSVARGLAWGAFFVGIVAETLEPTVSVLADPLGHAQALAVAMLACTFAYIAMFFVPRLIPETKGIDITTIQE